MKSTLLEWLYLFRASLKGVPVNILKGNAEFIIPCEKIVSDTGNLASGGFIWNASHPEKPLYVSYTPLSDSEKLLSSTHRELLGIYNFLLQRGNILQSRKCQFAILCDNQATIRALSGSGFRQCLALN